MRLVPTATMQAWQSGRYVGDNRPTVRATIQVPCNFIFHQDNSTYASVLFTGKNAIDESGRSDADKANYFPKELPNIKSIQWSRTTDQDAGTCTLQLWNTRILEVGENPTEGDFGDIGYYTYTNSHEWTRVLVPDRIIRTWEGYGWTPGSIPEKDPKLLMTGTWWIDSVEYVADGTITVNCRDLARLLMDQIVFLPVCPANRYPLILSPMVKVDTGKKPVRAVVWNDPGWAAQWTHNTWQYQNIPMRQAGARIPVRYDTCSAHPMGRSENQYGHLPQHAFNDGADYWLSEGYDNPGQWNAFPYIQMTVPNSSVDRVELKLFPETHRDLIVRPNPAVVVYVSVYADGKWQGHQVIPYQPHTNRGYRRKYHTVRAGESLQSIMEEELFWPWEWWPQYQSYPPVSDNIYAINEDIIGRYPHIRLYPGQKIRLPYERAIKPVPEPPLPDTHADIPYVGFWWLYDKYATKDWATILFPNPISRVTKIRLTIWNIGKWANVRPAWRAAIRSIVAYASWDKKHPTPLPPIPPGDPGTRIALPPGTHLGYNLVPTYRWNGAYSDYSDMIKLFCAWAGFYWPQEAKMPLSDGTLADPSYADFPIPGKKGDPALTFTLPQDQVKQIFYVTPEGTEQSYNFAQDGRYPTGYVRYLQSGGRVWGDVETTGTTGVVEFPIDQFDKKPLSDGVQLVRETLGFLFFIDETGGVIWRLPNYYSIGNWIWSPPFFDKEPLPAGCWTPDYRGRTRSMYTIDERQVLLGLRATLSGMNTRERVFVSTVDGKFGAAIGGFNPFPSGLRRVAGWTDQHFQSTAECLRMTQLIAMQQMMTYRTDSISIPGFPGIQIDDQVEIVETVTGERQRSLPQAWGVVPKRRGTVHYVKGIESSLDMESGDWTYNLSTVWLGVHPESLWIFNPNDLLPETKAFIKAVNQSPANPYVPTIPPLV